MNNETQPTFPKAQEFSTQPASPKRKSLFSFDFAKWRTSSGEKSSTWRERISRFLNPEPSKKHSYTKLEAQPKKIPSCLQSMQVSQPEADAFRMKAITLMQSKGIRFASIAEQLKTLQNAPILTSMETVCAPIISCYQILSPFPGEIIELQGSFIRNGKYSTPIPTSFQIFPRSQQSGFPHPLQHNGWALDRILVEMTGTPLDVVEKKSHLSKELRPDGSLIDQAKVLLKSKRTALQNGELITFHRQLAHAIVPDQPVAINQFFDRLQGMQDPYSIISKVYEAINQVVFYGKNLPEDETENHSFMLCMIDKLAPAVKNILFESSLTPFETKLLLAAYKQVREFMTDIDLRTQLESDISLFRS